MTMRERVLNTLQFVEPYKFGATATQLCHYLNVTHPMTHVKLSSLSGVLKRMVDAGELDREENFGPRGGYGYRLKEHT